jgi:hypothetical protein
MTIPDTLILLKAIKDSKVRLTNFEKDFCRSIVKRCALNKPITGPQEKVLSQIYARCSGQGIYQRRQYIA